VSHCDTGLLLADRWKLPLYIRESIAYHHEPEETPNYMVFSSVVHVANIMARALELGNSGDRVVPALSPAAWRTLNLSVTAIEPAMHKLVDVSRELCEILNLPGETS
jgi:HD-like signal output (HDOD) protein